MTSVDPPWLIEFFSKDNGWDLQKIRASAYPADLQLQLESLMVGAREAKMPFAVSRIDAQKQVFVYVVGEDRRQLAEIRSVMHAYLGAVRTSCDPQIYADSEDVSEQILLQAFPQGFVKLRVPQGLNANRTAVYSEFLNISRALERYAQRPLTVAVTKRPIGRILSDFFVACERHNGDAAANLADELRASGQLSTRNQISVELQALAAGYQWRRILSYPSLGDVLGGRIPSAVAEIVLEALKNVALLSTDPDTNDIGVLKERLRGLGGLFSGRPDPAACADAERWKVWAIGAAVFGNVRVRDGSPDGAVDHAWLDRLAKWAGLSKESVRSEASLDEMLRAVPSFDSAVKLLQSTLNANPSDGLRIYERLVGYPDAVISELKSRQRLGNIWRFLEDDYAPQCENDSWVSWFDSVEKDVAKAIPLQDLSEACRQWKGDSWDEELVALRLFQLSDKSQGAVLRGVIPILRKWLAEHKICPSAKFTEQMILILAVDDSRSVQDLPLVADLITDLTSVAHTEEQYRSAVANAVEIWCRVESTTSLPEGVEVLEVLLDCPCADIQARHSYWLSLQRFCLESWRRLADAQQVLIRRLSEDVTGSSEQFPIRQVENLSEEHTYADLTGRKLAIYTLTEGAGRRARAVLRELFPGLEVQLNHDKTATDALLNLAKTAEFFIFASRSAAHQAFYPVSQKRDDLLYPTGKGSSSIVRCFLDAVER